MPGFAFPSVGPLGLGSPPSRSGMGPRTFGTMQSSRLSPGPSRVASLLARFPLPCASSSVCVPFPARSRAEAPLSARSFVPPVHLVIRLSLTRRPMALPSSRVTPMKTCPALRPRWCPRRITLSRPGLLPSTRCKASAFHPLARAIILTDHDYTYFEALSSGLPSRYLRLRTPHYWSRTRLHY